MGDRGINTLNEALEFARRARQNLEFIEEAASRGADGDIHVVTQLALSLLGMLVFPKEKLLLDEIERRPLAELAKQGWPSWTITRDEPAKPTQTLGTLLRHVRNAVAHGRITFNSSRIEEVGLLVEDKYKREDAEPYWSAKIQAPQLKAFCLRFLDLIDDTIG